MELRGSLGRALPRPSPPTLIPFLRSPNRGNMSSSNEADVSGASNNDEHEGEDKECDLDLSKITDESLENIIRLLADRRSPTPVLLAVSTGKKKKRHKKRAKKDPSRRRSSPTPAFTEERYHDEEHSSSDEEGTSEGPDDAASPSVGMPIHVTVRRQPGAGSSLRAPIFVLFSFCTETSIEQRLAVGGGWRLAVGGLGCP